MKLLVLGLVPVIVFWFVEDKFGTFWGLIAAVVWALGECAFEYIKNRRVDKLTLLSTSLVVVLGGLGAWLDKSILFKFQPVIIEFVFASILYFGGRGGEPVMLRMARQSRPEIFNHQNEELGKKQKLLMIRMTRNLIVILIVHAVFLAAVAIRGTTGQWAFWKGIGFNVFLGVWILTEFGLAKIRRR